MYEIKLNVEEEFYEKFINFMGALPEKMVVIEEVNGIPYFPTIGFEEAKWRVQNAIKDIEKKQGLGIDEAFAKILNG